MMNLRSWGLDLDLDTLSQQFQENLQKAQEMMSQYSLDQLQQEDHERGADAQKNRVVPEIQHAGQPRGFAESKEMEETTPPSSARVITTSAPSIIEVTRLPSSTVPLSTALSMATATGSSIASDTQAVRKRSESKPAAPPAAAAAVAAPKGFFSDDSDVDLENDPILNRSRQLQAPAQTKADHSPPPPRAMSQVPISQPQQPARPPLADIENQLRSADPDDDDKKLRAPQPFISAFDKLSSSSSLSLDGVRRKLGFGAGSGSAASGTSALSRSRRVIQELQTKCTTGRKFHVTVLVLGVVMLCYFWRFTVVQG